MTIPEITLAQFGGNRALAMIGGKAGALGNTLVIRFKARAKNRANVLAIHLDADDTYTMGFYTKTGKEVFTISGVYFDMLRPIFEDHTGLYLSL